METATETASAGRRLISHPALALGSTLLWGLVELLALWRNRRRMPR